MNRYLVCIEPSPRVTDAVRRSQAQLLPLIGKFQGLNAPVHITLLLVDMPEDREPELTGAIAAGLENSSAFQLTLRGITYFRDQRTIYANPLERRDVLSLVASIAAEVKKLPAFEGYHQVVANVPHMTIAAGLKPPQFEAAWSTLKDQQIDERFEVRQVTLMSRALAPSGDYRVVHYYPLR
ncbi:MAG TPA: 2'-5' RNA ligase family protein [Flavobacteriales bacterium]|nr:2'-5' RNA ligase family protein [Flavobacteriales bacterium]